MGTILRFIVGLLTFVIGVAVLKIVLGLIGFALHLLWIAIVVGALALVGYVVYKIMFPHSPEHA